ncbi:MAG: glycosyltransferase family 4 protein [Oscillochloridaceae bacterium]|nr:glycosyltransferase family 4 protein [Chloroflexaceae bacterium]MDW8390620.1 glycosyltransferase family 4 protein [Oscillochloridaceae bacterium]
MAAHKRVLMVAPTPYFFDRGCHVQIYEVARSQQVNGNDVAIVTYHLGRTIGSIPTYRIPPIPWYRKGSAGPSWHKLYLDVLLMARTLQVARRYQPHIIHAHLHEGAAVALPVARLLGAPLLLDLQGSMVGELVNHGFVRPQGARFQAFRAIERQIIARVDGMLMWSYLSDALRRMFDFDPAKVFPVDYGVDLERFRPYPRERLADLYTRLGIPRERLLVVYLGVLSAYQGVDLLLEAIPAILRACPETHFLLMGYPDEERYRSRARALGIADHVTLPGRTDYAQAARYLSLGDVAVSAKLTPMEGNGKLLNYMACGLPTVAFDLPGNLATLGDAGVYAPTGDDAALAAQIIALLRDPARRADLGRRARLRAEQRYSWRAIGATINAVYDTLLARKAMGADPSTAAPGAETIAVKD